MKPSTVEIFATPEEQLSWLQVTAHSSVWCVHERRRVSVRTLVDIGQLTIESLGNEHSSARLFLGRVDLVPEPVWVQDGADTELDFVRSQAVLFEPSVQGKRALIAGRLAIMNRQEYDHAQIPFEPLHKWYNVLRRSLRRALAARPVKLVVVAPSMAPADARGSFIISRRAVELARGGFPLKQFPESRVLFEIA